MQDEIRQRIRNAKFKNNIEDKPYVAPYEYEGDVVRANQSEGVSVNAQILQNQHLGIQISSTRPRSRGDRDEKGQSVGDAHGQFDFGQHLVTQAEELLLNPFAPISRTEFSTIISNPFE